MASSVSIIGRTTRIRGRITGAVDLEVQGLVDGEISVEGDVTVEAQGMVGSTIRGRRLVVRGAVRGDLLGEESVLLEDGARVVGDVKAPRVAIATGALVRGFVDTGDAGASAPRAARPQAAARPQVSAPRVAPPIARAQQPGPAPAAAPPPPPKPVEKPAAKLSEPLVHASSSSNIAPSEGPRRPPPPVVPALKKVKGQIAKKKER
jgi:cytoskeletal protein CcmA (bactofilin family)